MSISKATADRHQRILLELVAQPGNNVCADCKRHNPRWASHNLGVFLCVTCASVHRKIGVHVTKVKSLTLDSWNKEQLETMKNWGNVKANQHYNPDERRHPPPANIEHTDRGSELENFIRLKYENKKFMGSPAKINRPASTTTSDSLAVPEPPSRSKSTPIRQSTAPPPTAPAVPSPASSLATIARPPRTSSISQTQTQPSMSAPQFISPTAASIQHQAPVQSSMPPPPPRPTPQTTGISSNVLNDMMAIQSNPPTALGTSGPSFSSSIQAQHTSAFGGSSLNVVNTSMGATYQQPPNTALAGSPFGLGMNMNTSPTGTPQMTSQFGMNPNSQQQQQHSFGSMSLSPGTSPGPMYPSSSFNFPTGNRSASLPSMMTGSSISSPPPPQAQAFSPQPTGTSLAQMAMSMSPPGSMSAQGQGNNNSSNPFLRQNPTPMGSPMGIDSPPLTNMYTGMGNSNPMQPGQQFSPFQQQYPSPGSGQAFGSMPDMNAGQFGGGGQTNPFGTQWGAQQNMGGFGSGGPGWHN